MFSTAYVHKACRDIRIAFALYVLGLSWESKLFLLQISVAEGHAMPTSTVSSVPTSSGSTITTDRSKSHQMKQKCNSKIVTTLAMLPNYTLRSIPSTQLFGTTISCCMWFCWNQITTLYCLFYWSLALPSPTSTLPPVATSRTITWAVATTLVVLILIIMAIFVVTVIIGLLRRWGYHAHREEYNVDMLAVQYRLAINYTYVCSK